MFLMISSWLQCSLQFINGYFAGLIQPKGGVAGLEN